MQKDFHYYATYCAAWLAGYRHDEALEIAYSAQLVDECSRTLLTGLKAPAAAATTQLQLELMDARTDPVGLQDITRIWASFHFLPRDLFARREKCSRLYRSKYRLLCGPNGPLVKDTVELAESGGSLQAAGLAMHVLADTWAHQYFAGTPSLVLNNTDYNFWELVPDGEGYRERPIVFRHNPTSPDDLEQGIYTNSLFQSRETSIMNLGHGRAGHLPDYSFMRYRYLPAWSGYGAVVKDNPADYMLAFRQMVRALKFLRGAAPAFAVEEYDREAVDPHAGAVRAILTRRQPDACGDWRVLGERLSGETIPDFDLNLCREEYRRAEDKDRTVLGRFILAALAQKSMVTDRIFRSGNLMAGFSVDYGRKGFRGIRDFRKLVEQIEREEKK